LNVLGIDPASGQAGLCLVSTETDTVLAHETNVAFKPAKDDIPELTMSRSLDSWEQRIEALMLKHRIDLVVVEKVSVSWNLDTVRKIAYFEAAAMLAARRAGVPAIMVQVTSARLHALGSGKLKKEQCSEMVREMHPEVDWQSDDETDAYVLAKAGPALLEKKANAKPKTRKRRKKTA
jgi:Holliday junction resolvasome RuvABC endonuclease subunit